MGKARIERSFPIGRPLARVFPRGHTLRCMAPPCPVLFWGKGFRPLRRATRGSARLAELTSGPRKPLKRLDLNFLSLLPSESAYRYLLPTRRVCKGCYLHNRGGRNAADQREQGSAGSAPGAFAKAVISTIEPVDSAYMRFAGDHRDQGSGSIPPLRVGQTTG